MACFWPHNNSLEDTEGNKNTHLADFETCVFREYLWNHLSYKNVIYIYLDPCLKRFQMEKEFFKSGHNISWYLQKRCFSRKKEAIGKNPLFWKKMKLFSCIEILRIEFTQNLLSGSKIITQPLQVKLDEFAIFCNFDFHQLSLQ